MIGRFLRSIDGLIICYSTLLNILTAFSPRGCAMNPAEELLILAKEQNLKIDDEAFAKYLDDKDEISHLRKLFYIPRISELLEESDVVDGPAKGSKC